MAKKKENKDKSLLSQSSEVVRLENLVAAIQQAVFELNDLLEELTQDFEDVSFDCFDYQDNLVNSTKRIQINKVWSM